MHTDVLAEWKKRLDAVIDAIFKLDYEANQKQTLDYVRTLQAMRLIQLAHQNHVEDFDLSYSLLIAGIEAIAQIAIPTKQIEKPASYNDWKNLCKKHRNDSDSEKLYELFKEYNEVRQYVNNEIAHRNLTERFVEFVLNYSPVEEWKVTTDEDLRYGLSDEIQDAFDNAFREAMDERTPDMLTDHGKQNLIKDTYKYRSGFFHEGASLPHRKPDGDSHNRFFEEVVNPKEWKKLDAVLKKENRNRITQEEYEKTKLYLITHDLMKNIARNAISNFLLELTCIANSDSGQAVCGVGKGGHS